MEDRLKRALLNQDGRCSYWFNGWWKGCCIQHDYDCADAYVAMNENDRSNADKVLRECVNKELKGMGSIMFSGIRSFLTVRKKIFGKKKY